MFAAIIMSGYAICYEFNVWLLHMNEIDRTSTTRNKIYKMEEEWMK